MKDELKLGISGHVLIRDVSDPGEPIVLLDKMNAIHKGNFIKHLAFNMAGKDNHGIHFMVFGTEGGADASENVRNEPDRGSALNKAVYGKKVNTYKDGANNITAVRSTESYAEIVVTCSVSNTDLPNFDELGLLSIDPEDPENLGEDNIPNGILLTHLTFENITTSSETEIVYTVRISG